MVFFIDFFADLYIIAWLYSYFTNSIKGAIDG